MVRGDFLRSIIGVRVSKILYRYTLHYVQSISIEYLMVQSITYSGMCSGTPSSALMSSAFGMSVHIDFDVLLALAQDP
jgi:hypothetical protein